MEAVHQDKEEGGGEGEEEEGASQGWSREAQERFQRLRYALESQQGVTGPRGPTTHGRARRAKRRRRHSEGSVLGSTFGFRERQIKQESQQATERPQLQAEQAELHTELQRKQSELRRNAGEIERLFAEVERNNCTEVGEEGSAAVKLAERRLFELRRQNAEEVSKAEEELVELQRTQRARLQQQKFQQEHGDWLGVVAGVLGMETLEELISVDDDGFYHLSKAVEAAKQEAVVMLHRYVCKNKATWSVLRSEHAFLRLIGLYFMKFDTFRMLRTGTTASFGINLQRDIERQLYQLLYGTFQLSRTHIAAKLLGELNHCH